MRILVFEFLTCGGVADQYPLDEITQGFQHQGHKMFHAVCDDLLELGHDVVSPVDSSIELPIPGSVLQIPVACEADVDSALLGAAVDVDHILLIAPESDGILAHYVSLLSSFASRFISPDVEFVSLTTDKWKCHQWLSSRDIACPGTVLLSENDNIGLPDSFFPCVAKPVDGAGSEGVQIVEDRKRLVGFSKTMLLQHFIDGLPVSVSVISQPNSKPIILEPGRQVFDAEPFGLHQRTEFPLNMPLRDRAIQLAMDVVEKLPNTCGYFGIDMVLGDNDTEDVVIEVNPRLTTSYAFLREWSGENLAKHFF